MYIHAINLYLNHILECEQDSSSCRRCTPYATQSLPLHIFQASISPHSTAILSLSRVLSYSREEIGILAVADTFWGFSHQFNPASFYFDP